MGSIREDPASPAQAHSRPLGGLGKRVSSADIPDVSKRRRLGGDHKSSGNSDHHKSVSDKNLPLPDPFVGLGAEQSNSMKSESQTPPRRTPSTSDQNKHWNSSDDSSDSLDENEDKKKKNNETDDTYRDYGSPDDDFEIEAQFDKEHARTQAGIERRNLVFELTQEKARRLAQAVRVPTNAKMGEGEKSLYLELALRGCKPVMFHHWKKDFSTLPESLFSSVDSSLTELEEIIFKTKARSEFHAIKAMKDLLDLGGQVRDCSLLSVYPPEVIRKAISKYIRWAISDSGLVTTPQTLPFHIIYAQKLSETTLDTVTKLVKKLTKLAIRHRVAYGETGNLYWPTLVGYVICGPIATILSLDSDPNSPAWSGPADTRVKYMGQFDLTEPDQDVWNSLALAISVIHVRETMLKLASVYGGPQAPIFRSTIGEFSDDD